MNDRILLPWPTELTMCVGDALKKRRTVRDCRTEQIPDNMLAALLWASAGVTDADGRRTVPSTLDLRAVSVWVVREDGAWRYNAKHNTLERTSKTDCREQTTSYQFEYVTKAPVTLVYVADHERAKAARPTAVYVDAGTMGQSAFLAATSLGLNGCIRASFDHDKLAQVMNLEEGLEPILLFTVGLPT